MDNRKRIHSVLWLTILLVVGIVRISVATEYEKVPILMIHGMGGNSTNWNTMKQRLRDNGYEDRLLYTIDMVNNGSLCSENHVTQISNKVEDIVLESGFERIDVMGHSRGGLNLYNYMRFDNGTNRVRNWISLGGSNHMCSTLYGPSPSDPTPGDQTLYTSIYSLTDELVAPEIAIIEGARNISIEKASHFTLIRNAEVFSYVLETLQGNGLNDGVAVSEPPATPTGLRILSSADLK